MIYIELYAFKNPASLVVIFLFLEIEPWKKYMPRVLNVLKEINKVFRQPKTKLSLNGSNLRAREARHPIDDG